MTKYEEIFQYMLLEINSGRYKIGDKFPTEVEIAKAKNVSHLTVRQAFRLLEDQGYVARHRGMGTFVKSLEKKESGNKTSDITAKPFVFYYRSEVKNGISSLFEHLLSQYPNIKLIFKKKGNNLPHYLKEHRSKRQISIFEFNDTLAYQNERLLSPLTFLEYKNIADLDAAQLLYEKVCDPLSPLLAVPVRNVVRLPVVNTTLAEKLSLNLKKLPSSWKDILTWCEIARSNGCKSPLCFSLESICNLIFHHYLSRALREEKNASHEKVLKKKPLVETLHYFKTLFKQYSFTLKKDRKNVNQFLRGDILFELFMGPWFSYEYKKHNISFAYAFLDKFISDDTASNFSYASTSFIGYFANEKLNNLEKDFLHSFFNYVSSRAFQKSILITDEGYPSLASHRGLQVEQMQKDPEIIPYYRSSFTPLWRHNVSVYSAWRLLIPEIKSFFESDMSTAELWERIDWMQKREEYSSQEIAM